MINIWKNYVLLISNSKRNFIKGKENANGLTYTCIRLKKLITAFSKIMKPNCSCLLVYLGSEERRRINKNYKCVPKKKNKNYNYCFGFNSSLIQIKLKTSRDNEQKKMHSGCLTLIFIFVTSKLYSLQHYYPFVTSTALMCLCPYI